MLYRVFFLVPADTKFSTRTTSILPFSGRVRASRIWDTQVRIAQALLILYSYNFSNSYISDQIWLMSRERKDFSLEIRTIIHDALTRLGLDPERLVLSKNRNCPKTLWIWQLQNYLSFNPILNWAHSYTSRVTYLFLSFSINIWRKWIIFFVVEEYRIHSVHFCNSHLKQAKNVIILIYSLFFCFNRFSCNYCDNWERKRGREKK